VPTLQLKISPPREAASYTRLARQLTDITAATLGKRAEVTALMIEELPAARWYVGAALVQRPTAWLEISITASTNTVAQKSAFIEAAYAALEDLAGGGQSPSGVPGLEPASYVIVREVPATDWGYGGQTQAARRSVDKEKGP
jgi:4-oxalocrotonate tautomerase